MHFLITKKAKEAGDGGNPAPWRHGGEATRRPPTPIPSTQSQAPTNWINRTLLRANKGPVILAVARITKKIGDRILNWTVKMSWMPCQPTARILQANPTKTFKTLNQGLCVNLENQNLSTAKGKNNRK
jgi:hypothetical protein